MPTSIDNPTVALPPTRPAAVRRHLGRLLRDAAIVVMILLCAELLLRRFAPQYDHQVYDEDFTGSCPLQFNAMGSRGPLPPLQKGPGELRLLGLGDSTTFGTGIAASDTWPLRLRTVLADRSRRSVTAINAGAQGASLADLQLAYDRQWTRFHPDVVGVVISGNMISLAWIHRDSKPSMPDYAVRRHEPSRVQRLKRQVVRNVDRLCLPGFLSINSQRGLYWIGVLNHDINPAAPYGAVLAHGWRQANLDPSEADAAWTDFARELTSLRDDVAGHGQLLLATYLPSRFDLSDSVFDNEKNVPRRRLTIDPCRRAAELCATLGIAFVDAKSVLLNDRTRIERTDHRRASLYVLGDYTHLDREGSSALARAMADRLEPLLRKRSSASP